MIPALTQEPPNEKRVQNFQKGMEKALKDIQDIWLENGQKKYLGGDKISVADIIAVCELEQPFLTRIAMKARRMLIFSAT